MTVVAIDGPGGAGKSTVAAALARRLGVRHVDTGAYYRAAALAVLRAGVDPADAGTVAALVAGLGIRRDNGRTRLDGEDVEDEIRSAEVTRIVSAVAAHPQVRALLLVRQREEVGEHGAVVEGRDAGTVVVPDADLKVWLTASPYERAARRAAQAASPSAAADADAIAAHAADLARRDASDAAQMLRAPDVIEIDTTGVEIDSLVEDLVRRVGHDAASGA